MTKAPLLQGFTYILEEKMVGDERLEVAYPESGGAKVGHGSGGIMLLRAE